MRNLSGRLFRLALLAPAFWWAYQIFLGDLGADPAKTLNHASGEMALYYLMLNLLIGVLIAFSVRFPTPLRFLLRARRFLGVTTFFFLVFHLFLYLTMEGFEPQAFAQLTSKTYLQFGFAAWLIFLVLTLTSNDFSVRRLGGKQWKNIHRSVYLATALVTVHVLLIEKADLVKFGWLFGILWLIEGLRWLAALRAHLRKRRSPNEIVTNQAP